MKTILRVAKTELRTLFYSPIAWFLLIVFLIQCGIVYLGPLGNYARSQELGGRNVQFMEDLTTRIFFDRSGLFGSVMQNLYLYIPLLTMSLISRETGSGTIKLLYSSPIKIREIILGKYLAMVMYSLLLVAIVAIFVVSGMMQIQNPETGMLLTSLLGFFLLLCAYSAIGLFMSTLTTYQIVAAVCTFVMIGALSYIGTLWQRVAFVRELTYFLSINGRTVKMLGGLVTSKDVIYFLVIVYIFLGLSIYKLKAGTESKPALVKAGRYIAVIASALLIGYVSSIPGFIAYFDATSTKRNTITPQVQKVLADLGDEPLEVTAYNNLLGRYWFLGAPESFNQINGAWEPYTRFKHNIKLNTPVNYYDSANDNPYLFRSYPGSSLPDLAQKFAKSNDIKLNTIKTPAEIRQLIDLRPEDNRYVMQLKWKGRTTFLRVFDDMQIWPGETEMAAAFKRLQQARLPKIGFLVGDLERDINKVGDRDYQMLTNMSSFRNSLVNQGFDVDTVSLETQDMPADITTLVVANPKVALSANTMARLQQYIDKGGNLLIAGEPGKQDILNPLLKQLDVQFMDGMLIQQSKNLSPNIVAPWVTKQGAAFTKSLAQKAADSLPVSMPGAAGLAYTTGGAWTVQPLLMTDARLTWNRIKPLDLDMAMEASAGNSADDDDNTPATAVTPAVVKKETASAKRAVKVPTAAATGNTATNNASMDERQQKAKTLQDGMNAIVKGEGTDEEKKTKMRELMANANKQAADGMTPELKKRSDSVRAVFDAIRTGPGTPQEKQQKVMELMAGLKKNREAREAAQTAPATVKKVTNQAPVVQVAAGPAPVVSNAPRGRGRSAMGTVAFSPADGDVKGPIPTVISLTRSVNGKEQRIIVAGDADFMSNAELTRFNLRNSNFVFNTALFSWLSNGEFPIDATRPHATDKRVKVTMDQVDFLRIIYIWTLPGLLLAFAAILLIRRKRK
jgi:ABC-2 type transport system permease protein